MENPPTILKVKNRKFILDKVYEKNRYALYSNMEYGYRECFNFWELNILSEMVKPPQYRSPEKVIYT